MPLSVFSLLLVVFSLTTGEFVIAGILPDVAAGLSVSVGSAGLLVTAYAIGMIVGGPLVTLATARVARKPLIAGLIVVSMAGNLGSAFAPGYALAVVSRFVAGLVVATFFAVAIATVVSMAPPGRAVSTIAKVTMGLNLGIVAGSPLGTVLGHHLGWRATFGAVAVVSGIALLLVLRFVPAQPATGSMRGELRVLADRNVWQAIGLTVLGNVGVVTVFTYIAPLLTDVSGFSSELLPVLLVLYGVGAVAGNYLGGRWADRALLPSLAWMLAALVVALAAAWLGSPVKPVMIGLVFVLGMLAFGIVPGMQARVIAAGSSAPTLAVAVNASGFQLAAAVAGLLGGQVIARAPQSIYLLAAVLTVIGLGIALYALRRERLSTDSRR
ncbi:MFS transporter [Amycolatopsis sp. Poz14]|uniref:MFS transporter n=1 Tax=Amycolatopsis sp. Poz14 TaxID=1447705 RepID=UPI001EE994A9|nr:MFS transporter [Amycolatopsis sp. Poz14]MCG3750545.1 MFS transporter [Amycolatopsis sp. Poz14]